MTHLWARSVTGAPPRVVGSWTNGTPVPLGARSDGWYVTSFELPAGDYTYELDERGERRIDPLQPLSQWDGGVERSLLVVPDCSAPSATIERVDVSTDGVTVEGHFLSAGRSPAPLARVTSDDGVSLSLDPSTGTFTAKAPPAPRGKRTLTFVATDTSGRTATTHTSVFDGARHASWEDAIVYQVITDRFRAPDGGFLPKPKTPGSRAGGTLDGVRRGLSAVESLGATAVWISPVYQNPTGVFPGRDGRAYEGYHGYWPSSSRDVDAAIGGEKALSSLVADAHARGLSVIADLVPNHVHEQNPRYQTADRASSFHTQDACVCGEPGCGWGDRILDCWFTPYLPDVKLESPAEMRRASDDALFWVKTFDFDGVRLDAVPMMPRASTRYLAKALRDDGGPPDRRLVMGEVFTGPGDGGVENIRYFIGPSGLDSAFDFPLMWAIRGALTGAASFVDVDGVLALEEERYARSGTLPARILGNHDTPRLMSELMGDGAGDPWVAPPAQPTDGDAFDRAALAHALVFTLPGIPVVYQGDEVGLAGAGDPDNRRVMPDDASLSPRQRALRDTVGWLAKLRTCSTALRRGDRTALVSGKRTYAYARSTTDEEALVVMSNEPSAAAISLSKSGDWVDARTGEHFALPGVVGMPRLGLRVLLRAGDRCIGGGH